MNNWHLLNMRVLCMVCLVLFVLPVKAQSAGDKQAALDSLSEKLKADSLWNYRFKKLRPYFAFDNRNSFIRSAPVNFRGLQAGIIVKERHTMGLGLYRISQKSQRPVRTLDNNKRIVNQYLNLNYVSFFYELTIVKKRFFEITIPIEAGRGRADIKVIDSLSQIQLRDDHLRIFPFGGGLQLVAKPFKWIGVSTMGGYRYVSEKSVNLNFNGWYYAIGIWLDPRQIYRDIRYYGVKKKKYRREVKKVLVRYKE